MGSVQGKYQWGTEKGGLTTKLQAQLTPNQPSVSQAELEYNGSDYSLNLKLINPDFVTQALPTGILTASVLQSVHSRLALGLEAIVQRVADPMMSRGKRSPVVMQDISIGGVGKISIGNNGTLTVGLQQGALLQASYHHRVNEKIDMATDWQAILAGPRADSVCTVGARFDLRQAQIRAQLDTTGKVGLHYEERLFPGFSLLLSGELDHAHGGSRWGVGVNLEN